jgi:hypothetical protein
VALTFLGLGDGHIGSVEDAPAAAEFVSVGMVERRQATPLEAHMAYGWNGKTVEHYRLGPPGPCRP